MMASKSWSLSCSNFRPPMNITLLIFYILITLTLFRINVNASPVGTIDDRFANAKSDRNITSINVFDFLSDFDGIPNDSSAHVCDYNTKLLSSILQYNISDSTLIIPSNETFYFHCGIYGNNVTNATLQIDGVMRFEKMSKKDDTEAHDPAPCIMIDQSNEVTITSKYATSQNNYRGLIDGQGSFYWGVPVIGFLEDAESRPRLIRFNQTTGLLIENMVFQDSPYHAMYLEDVHNVVIRNISIVARRTYNDGHSIIDLSAFNTDGIDVSGSNVHIHDIDIWTQDDCIAVKDNYYTGVSKDMLFENINASGLGFVIGSIGNTTVSNITFRNSYLHRPVKGVYMKFHSFDIDDHNSGGGSIDNIVYDNITIYQPIQWPIWIGPAQQSDSKFPCHANPCSLCWPQIPNARCNIVDTSYFSNITLSNIKIIQPTMSPGVIMGTHGHDQSFEEDQDLQFAKYEESEYNSEMRVVDGIPHIDGMVFHNVQVVPTSGFWKRSAMLERSDLLITFPGLKQPIHDHYVPSAKEIQYITDDIIAPCAKILVFLLTFGTIYYMTRTARRNSGVANHHHHRIMVDGEDVDELLDSTDDNTMHKSPSAISLQRALQASLLGEKDDECEEDNLSDETENSSVSDDDDGTISSEKIGKRSRTATITYVILAISLAINVGLIVITTTNIVPTTKHYMHHFWSKHSWDDTTKYYQCNGVMNGIASGNTWPIPSCFQDATAQRSANSVHRWRRWQLQLDRRSLRK